MDLFLLTVIIINADSLGRYITDSSRFLGYHADTGVYCCLFFHTGTYYRCFGAQKRHGLTLHVGSHQCTVRIVVLQERNQCSSHREYHSRGYIHVIKHFPGIFLCLIQITSGDGFSHEMSFCIQCFVRLCYMIIIFFVRSHVDYFVGNAGVLGIGLVDLTIRSLYETIFINSCITCKRVDQTDVRTFGSLDRAHSSVMGIMYISNFESGTISGQTAGAQCRQTSLVGQLTQRVILIHKLRQLGRSEEFLHCCGYGFDIDQRLGRDLLSIVCGHTLAYHSLHSGQTDTILVLQQFTYRTDTSVAQMIDIVIIAQTILQMHVIVNGSQNIFLGNMLGYQFMYILLDRFCQLLGIIAELFQDLCQNRIIYQLMNTEISGIAIYIMSQIYHQVRQYLYVLLLCLNIYERNGAVLNGICQLCGHLVSCGCDHFTGGRIYHICSQDLMTDTILQS